MADRLTREQAAIVSLYTGILSGPFEDMHEYAERLLGYPILTHEFSEPERTEELKALAKDDFVALCAERDDE